MPNIFKLKRPNFREKSFRYLEDLGEAGDDLSRVFHSVWSESGCSESIHHSAAPFGSLEPGVLILV